MSTTTVAPADATITAERHGHGRHALAHAPARDDVEAHRSWLTFAFMIATQIMVIIDVSVTYVALPSISRGLHLSSSQYQWTVSAYVLLSGGLLLLGGRIADLFDRRSAFLAGVGLFTAASIASGLATTPLMLILARTSQGAGAALATPAALSIVMTAYTGRQRQKALAIWGAIGSAGIAIGVLAGGAPHERARLARGLLHQRTDLRGRARRTARREAVRHPPWKGRPGRRPRPRPRRPLT